MRIHCFQHVAFEGPAAIGSWARARGHALAATRFFAGEPLPALGAVDWLVVLGGPMGAGDESVYPWLRAEKRFIGKAIANGKTVLGICLGAQLIAEVLGGRVFRNPSREIGWFPIELTSEARRLPLFSGLPAAFDAFHWHGDTFTLPAGAVKIARSEACENQGFLHGDRTLALQFHLETTRESARALIENCAGEMTVAPYVQSAAQVLAEEERFARLHEAMGAVFERLEAGAAACGRA